MPRRPSAALAATGLLDRHGRGLAFRHEIARLAVLEAVAPGSEAALHVAMIDALEAAGGDAERAGPPRAGRRRVPGVEVRARRRGDASRSGAHREAVGFFEPALCHVGNDPATRAGLLEALADDLYLTDRPRDAIAARAQALELRRALGDIVAVGDGPPRPVAVQWYAADLL